MDDKDLTVAWMCAIVVLGYFVCASWLLAGSGMRLEILFILATLFIGLIFLALAISNRPK